MFAAARATREAGAPEAALGLAAQAGAGPLDELQAAQLEYLRGQIAADQRRSGDAARLLLSAARRLEPLNAAWQAWERQPVAVGVFAVPELAEAAARTGEVPLARGALAWLSDLGQVALPA